MKSLEELARVRGIGDFASFIRLLAINKGSASNALSMAEGRASDRVVQVLRAAVSAGGAGGSGAWAEQLVGYRVLVASFMDQLRHASAFLKMLADGAIVKLPLNTVIGDIRTSSSAAIVQPGAPIPVSSMSIANTTLERKKAAGLVVMTTELLRAAPEAESLITRNLRTSTGEAVDREVFTELLGSITLMTSTGFWQDMTALLDAVGPDQESRLYFLGDQSMGNLLATTGDPARFPRVGPLGGEVLPNTPFL